MASRWWRTRPPRTGPGEPADAPGPALAGRRDRAALGRAIRGIADTPDLAAAAQLIAAQAAWMLRAEGALVVLAGADGGVRVAASAGEGVPPPGTPVEVDGALASALDTGAVQELRALGRAQAVAPVTVGGRAWGAIQVAGPAGRVGRHAGERLAPFADLVSLAATTHEARARLASLAGTDPLTGLGNRRTFDGLLAVEIGRARRHGDPLGLVMLDLDGFKAVNDRHGHQAGDRVLIEVGRRLVEIARRGEAISRIGGEEFAWVLPRTDAAGTTAAAARALEAIAATPFEDVGTLTISAGVCELAEAGSADELVRLADRMLYRAKSAGRNTVRCHVPEGALARTG